MQLETNIDDRIESLHQSAKLLLKANHSEETVALALEKEGIEKEYAYLIIENVKTDLYDRRQFWKLQFTGWFLILSGFLINYFSYKIAEAENSISFYLFWGIIVTGFILIARAFILFRK